MLPKQNYITKIDEASSTVTYIGRAARGSTTTAAVWQIMKVTVSGNITTIAWAGGFDTFINVWDDRAGLSYS